MVPQKAHMQLCDCPSASEVTLKDRGKINIQSATISYDIAQSGVQSMGSTDALYILCSNLNV